MALTDIKFGAVSLVHYTYDDLNRRDEVSYYNGTSVVYDYEDYTGDDDLGSDIEGVHHYWASSEEMNITYVRDKVGNIVGRYIEGRDINDKYDYDALYQVKNVWYGYDPSAGDPSPSSSDLEVEYTYDLVGNRQYIYYDDSLIGQYYRGAYNELNQYSSVDFDSQSQTIDHDVNGNMTQLGSKVFGYDYLNRMTSATVNSVDCTYEYDAFGRRVFSDIDGTQTAYVYDGAQVIAEYTISGSTLTLSKRFIYGPSIDEPVIMIDCITQAAYYYHYDAKGNVLGLSDWSGDVVEMYDYDVYGAVKVHTAAGNDGDWLTGDDTLASPSDVSTVGNPYFFTGRRYDAETGLYYYRARMYSPELGRFCQPDPIGYADGMNMYAYCGNNPINWIDPWGLCKDEDEEGGLFDAIKEIPWFNPLPLAIFNKANEMEDEEYGEYSDPFGGDYRHFIGGGLVARKYGLGLGAIALGIDSLFFEDDPNDMKANWRGFYNAFRHPLTPLRDMGKDNIKRPPGPKLPDADND